MQVISIIKSPLFKLEEKESKLTKVVPKVKMGSRKRYQKKMKNLKAPDCSLHNSTTSGKKKKTLQEVQG